MLPGLNKWWQVYDVAEALYREANADPVAPNGKHFQAQLNKYCLRHRVGWQKGPLMAPVVEVVRRRSFDQGRLTS
jgi:hypothetical protein